MRRDVAQEMFKLVAGKNELKKNARSNPGRAHSDGCYKMVNLDFARKLADR